LVEEHLPELRFVLLVDPRELRLSTEAENVGELVIVGAKSLQCRCVVDGTL
jgi:hypothetical protein